MKRFNSELIFIGVILTCAFIYNPLALVFPYGSKLSSYIFFFNAPHVFIAASASLIYCCLNYTLLDFQNKLIRLSLAAIFLIFLSGFIFGSHFQKVLENIAFFSVPIAISIAVQKDSRVEQFILKTISLLWFISIFYCLIWPGNQKIGFSGNQNWLAATLLSSAILTFAWLKSFLDLQKFKLCLLILIPLNLYVLNLCQARVLYPACLVSALYICWLKLPKKVNFILWNLCLLGAVSVFSFKQDYIQRSLNLDIRGPLYKDTTSMILDSPFLGHGTGYFQRDFPLFASDELKQKIVYSPITEHPHNEFLRLAVESGLIVGLLWIAFLVLSFKKNNAEPKLFSQLTILILFIMGMADKPLIVSSSAIIFLIAVGLNLKLSIKSSSQQPSSQIRLLPAVLILVFLGFRLSQVLPSQYYKWQGEQAKSAYQKTNDMRLVPIMEELYGKSAAADPYAIYPQYAYASVLAHFSKNLALVQQNLQKTISLEPYFSDINFHIGQFYQKQINLVAAKDRDEYLQIAEDHYKMNLTSSPWSLKRNRQMIYFYGKFQEYDKALNSLNQLRKISRQKLTTLYTYPGKGDLKKELQDSLNAAIKQPTNMSMFTSSLKGNISQSYFYGNIKKHFPKHNEYVSNHFFEKDWLFWHDTINLNHQLKDMNSIQDLIDAIQTKKINPEKQIQPPRASWESTEVSPKSFAGLLTHIAYSKGWTACSYEEADSLYTLIFSTNETIIIDCMAAKVVNKKLSELRKGKFTLLLQADKFIVRNQLLSDLLSIDATFPQLCKGPTEATLLLLPKLQGKRPELDLAYFELLSR